MWYYKNKIYEFDDNWLGFVYLITNLTNNKKYIGKKKFIKSLKKRPTKKCKRPKRIVQESDWMDYYGSSDELNRDVEFLGKDKFKREILHLCQSLGEMSYLEMKEQIDNNVLFRDDYYNSYIGGRIHRKHLKSLKNITLT